MVYYIRKIWKKLISFQNAKTSLMNRLFFVTLGLMPYLIAGQPEKALRPHSYLEETREFMKQFRESSHLTNTLLVEDGTTIAEDYVKEAFKDTAHISEKNRKEIRALLGHPLLSNWAPDLLGGPADVISRDSLYRLVKAAEASKSSPDFFLEKDVYSFSAPVFFQNGTLCLFYAGEYGGSNSSICQVWLFRKDGDQWKMIKSLFSLVS